MSASKVLTGLVLLSTCFSAAVMASADGKVNFTGKIVDTPCVVSSDSASLDVALGQYKAASFVKANDTSDYKDFAIHLDDCAIDTLKTASVQFNGTPASDNNSLGLTSGATTAKGVAIEISDAKNVVVPVNTASSYTNLQKGESTLYFKARYKAMSVPVTSGEANSSADFSVTYK